jgi:hypothetical protein
VARLITRRRTRQTTYAMTWAAGLLLVGGVVAAIVAFVPEGKPIPEHFSKQPPQIVKHEGNLPVPREVRRVAGRFIQTAVRRVHLEEAWELVGPQIRQDLTFKEWMTGNIPVVPFTAPIKLGAYKLDFSRPGDVLLEIALIPINSSKVKPQTFFVEVKLFGKGADARWLVDSWTPRGGIPIPIVPG